MAVESGVVDGVLMNLLGYEEVLGAVALSIDGLVIGSAGVCGPDADLVGALGASLVGAAERTARRLGAGVAAEINVGTSEGMIHLRSGGDFAVMVFAERCENLALGEVCAEAVLDLARLLDPA